MVGSWDSQGSPSVEFIPASSSKLRNQLVRPESDDEDNDDEQPGSEDEDVGGGPSSDVVEMDGGNKFQMTPSANRRAIEAAERKAVREKRKEQVNALSGRRAGLEKAKVRKKET